MIFTKPLKIMTVFGTRPEAIKMAPLIQELQHHRDDFETIVAVTGQHRDMLDQVLARFDIKPNYDLNIMKKTQTLSGITTSVLNGLDELLKQTKPDLVLVHGDTTTTFSASLSAFYNEIAVGHVEAGLRTGNKYAPFPEEMNRQLTGVIADLHFAPTEKAKNQLLAEQKDPKAIFVTGNTVIDALKTTVDSTFSHPIFEEAQGKKLILLTAHRRENLGNTMREMFTAIKRLADTHEDVFIVYPVHKNPVVVELAEEILQNHERISLIEPLNVFEFHNIMAQATLVLTDSGGIQEEAPSLGVPVLVMRNTTEREEGIEAGTLELVGTKEETIYNSAHELLTNKSLYQKMSRANNPYGDGKASERIVAAIKQYFRKN